jgi:hypothetical protein
MAGGHDYFSVGGFDWGLLFSWHAGKYNSEVPRNSKILYDILLITTNM